jgi:hypothetical protein
LVLWAHYSKPEPKRHSMAYFTGSPRPKKFKSALSARKIITTVLWD